MAKKFLTTVESPVKEACCDLLQLSVTQLSVKKAFIMTCRPDEWVFIAKDKETLQQLYPKSKKNIK